MLAQIQSDLNKSLISTKVLTSNFKFIDENNKKTCSFNDSKYIPFYYYLGKYINPKKVVELGFNLGLTSSVFFKSCKTTEYFLGIQIKTNEPWDRKLAESNLKINYKNKFDTYYGNISDKNFFYLVDQNKFDLCIINAIGGYDTIYTCADYIYSNLNKNSYFVMDYINKSEKNKEIFFNIANGYKKEYKIFNTRNGTGVILK